MKDGGPALPSARDGQVMGAKGMSLRDWFAGQALVGMLALQSGRSIPGNTLDCGSLVSQSYLLADFMLSEREKAR